MTMVRRGSKRWEAWIATAVLAGVFLAAYGSLFRELGRLGTDTAVAASLTRFDEASDTSSAGASWMRRPPPMHGVAWVPHDRVDTVPTAPFRRAAAHDTGGGPAAGLLRGPALPGSVGPSPAGLQRGALPPATDQAGIQATPCRDLA